MNPRIFITCLGALLLGASISGCSFSLHAGNLHTLEGQKNIVVKADRPEEKKPALVRATRVAVVGDKIKINEKVQFDTGKATIKTDSDSLLQEISTVMQEHSKIKKVRIEGHTDNVGSDKANKALSQDRATSVMEFLTKAGIDASRLEAVGYGEGKPVADNDTDNGKETNRRVEFTILDQD